ncbi:helix-turn-helix transcriptional regulator [Pseudomonas putida]|uniref:helix-turn-helix transcriptional regulator n=1 Tax=Pseudomonas putida TaxID=303 RepID=UPI0021565B0B|nr:WYL domain-containing protein [Pseudomonas putida]
MKLEDMDAPTALALFLSESHLSPILPQSVLDQLAPQFRRARNFLSGLGGNGLADWSKRVRSLPNGKTLLPAQVTAQAWTQVSAGLLERKQLQVIYRSRSKGELKHLRLHPAGLVSRHAVSYLLASVDGYNDLRQFALHRITEVRVLEEPADAHESFDVDAYIASGVFSYREAGAHVELIADVRPQIAALLNETPLSQQQTLSSLSDQGWHRLHATVPLDRETLWWIFALNENIHLHAPQVWVDEVRERLNSMQALYQQPSTTAQLHPA